MTQKNLNLKACECVCECVCKNVSKFGKNVINTSQNYATIPFYYSELEQFILKNGFLMLWIFSLELSILKTVAFRFVKAQKTEKPRGRREGVRERER